MTLPRLRLWLYLGFNLATLGATLLVPFAWELVLVALASFYARMLAVTAVYHRLFSHRAYVPRNRGVQLALALWALTSAQRGPIWWATAHRWHHRHADTALDLHSPRHRGFWESHVLWVFTMRRDPHFDPRPPADLTRHPELVFLDRFDFLGPLGLGLALYAAGGWPWVVWGLGVSTVALWHASSSVNSLAHLYGTRRHDTPDDSRNLAWLLPLTLGECWHNNHHAHPGAARHGHGPWEPDPTGAFIEGMAAVGLVRRLGRPPTDAEAV